MSNADSTTTQKEETVQQGTTMNESSGSEQQQQEGVTVVPDEKELGQKPSVSPSVLEDCVVLKQLAVQLEYYFSKKNLSKDTYLQTLRNLNDGCVPVTILANFAKVKSIVGQYPAALMDEQVRKQAILKAIQDSHSQLLQINSIDTESGKIVSETADRKPINTILAIGPITKEPLDVVVPSTPPVLSHSHSFASSSGAGSISNTIILRDVLPSVTEDEVRLLFQQVPECPPIVGITRDVANCWFITFDADARELMMNIMMQVRTMKLGGEYVMARLKASSTNLAGVDVYSPPITHIESTGSLQSLNSSGSRKKKKKARGKKNRSRRGNNESPSNTPNAERNVKQVAKKTPPPPPSFTAEQFPSLNDEKKVEWETPPGDGRDNEKTMEDDNKSEGSVESPKSKAFSDVASTATTTSSSMESYSKKAITTGGYAAAVMKAPVKQEMAPQSKASSSGPKKEAKKRQEDKSAQSTKDSSQPPMKVTAPAWGRGRSFAEIVKQEKEATKASQ